LNSSSIRNLQLPPAEIERLRRASMQLNVRNARWWAGIILICAGPIVGTFIFIWLVHTQRISTGGRYNLFEENGKLFMVVVGFCAMAVGLPLAIPVARRNLATVLATENRCLGCGRSLQETSQASCSCRDRDGQ
jgi:hypothetical protein